MNEKSSNNQKMHGVFYTPFGGEGYTIDTLYFRYKSTGNYDACGFINRLTRNGAEYYTCNGTTVVAHTERVGDAYKTTVYRNSSEFDIAEMSSIHDSKSDADTYLKSIFERAMVLYPSKIFTY